MKEILKKFMKDKLYYPDRFLIASIRAFFNKIAYANYIFYRIISNKQKIDVVRKNILFEDVDFNMFIPILDDGIGKELFLAPLREKEYTLANINLLKHISDKIDYVLDIGSNIGYFALLELFILRNKPQIYYFIEPVPKNFELLEINVNFLAKKLNIDYNKIVLHRKAITPKNGMFFMEVPSKGNWSRITSNSSNGTNIIKVEGLTLNDLIEQKMLKGTFFIRLDIEGFEYEIFKNSYEIFKKMEKLYLSIELHPHLLGKEKTLELLKLMQKMDLSLKECIISTNPVYDFFKGVLGKIHKELNHYLNSKLYSICKEINSLDKLFLYYKKEQLPLIGIHLIMDK